MVMRTSDGRRRPLADRIGAMPSEAPGVTGAQPAQLIGSVCIFGWGLRGGTFANLGATLTHGFRELGWDARLLVVRAPAEESVDRFIEIPFRVLGSRRSATSVPALAKYLRRECPDVILPLSTMMNIPAILACGLAGGRSAVVVTEHTDLSMATSRADGAGAKMRLLRPLVTRLYPHAAGLISVSRRWLENPVLTSLLRRLPHAVIGNPYTWDVLKRADLEAPHPWLVDEDRPATFLAAGALVPVKGFAVLIRALAKLRQMGTKGLRIIYRAG